GRDADIVVSEPTIPSTQCSFEIHQHTGEILLYDWSRDWSTQTFGPDATPFEPQRPGRRVVITEELNLKFQFGGARGDMFKFGIHWYENLPNISAQLPYREENHRFARALDNDIMTA